MSVTSCLMKHLGAKSPINAYRAEMQGDVQELVDGGMTQDAAWLQVTEAKLTELKAERARIEQVVAEAYAKTAAGGPKPNGASFGTLYHGTPLPFDAFTISDQRDRGAGYDHQGRAIYLTSDAPGFARFFARESGARLALRLASEGKEAESNAVADGDGHVMSVKLADGARILRLEEAPPAIRKLFESSVGDKDVGARLRQAVLDAGYDGLDFQEPNFPEGWYTTPGARTLALYDPAKATITGSRPAGELTAEARSKTAAGKPAATAPAADADAEEIALREGDFNKVLRLRKERQAAERAAVGDIGDGAVLRHEGGKRFVMVLPDVDGGGKWRIQRFDAQGFSGHMVYNSPDEALDAALGEGFKTRDDSALDRMQSTPEWERGMFAADLIQKMNGGDITRAEGDRLLAEFDAKVKATPAAAPAKPTVYKTRRGAEEAKTGNTQRIKKVQGGFILRDATDKEMAAAERNGRRLAAGGGVDVERDSLLTAIAKLGGIAMSDRADTIGEGNKNLAGKMLFTRDGKAIDLLASEDMIDFGYIPAEFRDDPEAWLRDAIKSEFMGERSYFSEQGTEWMQEGVDQPTDAELAEWGIDDLEQDGYTAASPEVQALTEQMIAEADALGIDTETIREDAARSTEGLPANDYHFAVQEAIRRAFRQVASDAARRDTGAAQAGDRDRVEAAGAQGDQEGLTLEAPTRAQVLAQQDALERERADREAAAEKPKSKLTGEQVDIFNPQGSVFDVPAEPAPAQPAAASATTDAQQAAPSAPAPAAPAKPNTEDAGEELTANRRNRIKTGIKWSDIADKNDALKVKEAVKQNVYPRPDYEAMVDGGMQPLVAHLVKQVYDSIAAKPAVRGIPTDADLQTYIAGINRVMAGALAWANDKASVAAWARRESRGAGAMLGQATNLSDLAGRTDAKSMLEYVAPNGWREHLAEFRIVGSNKVLGALQPGYDESTRAIKAINDGWPASQEAWQKRGLKVVQADKIGTTYYESKATSRAGTYVSINFKVGKHDYKQESIDGVDSREAPEVKAAVAAEIADTEGKWLILSKYGRLVSKHDSEEAATEAARAMVKRGGKEGGPDDSGIDVSMATREGPARRLEGENVSSDQVKEAFGFRAVNFGNWMKGDSPAKVAERQAHLNHAYDSFMDLADLFGVPPRAMSLNGMLGLAIGAQGTGGSRAAAAHFVPGVNEINLTRASGAGSLAHEWGHALDHYFATQAGLAKAPEPFLTEHTTRPVGGTLRPEIMAAFKSIVTAMNRKSESAVQLGVRVAAEKSKARRNVDGWLRSIRRDFVAAKVDEAEFDRIAKRITDLDLGDGKIMAGPATAISPAVDELRALYQKTTGKRYSIDQIKGLSANIDHLAYISQSREHVSQFTATEYAENARKMDKEKGGKPYWGTNLEKFARAFDAFVSDELEAKAAKNSYLSHTGRTGETVPTGDERTVINAAIKTLVDSIQTREDDAGNVAMFSIADNGEAAALQALAASDDLFALPKSDKDTIAGIAADVDPTIKVSAPTGSPSGTQVYTLTMPEGTKATISVRQPSRLGPDLYAFDLVDGEMVNQVTERPGENPDDVDPTPDVWLDVSKLTSGDAGARVYAIASNFAHNTGSIFIGDPAGLTDAAMRRRLEHMLSSALKFGTTRHLAPHPRQVAGGVGVPALKWVYGDDLGNIERMIDASVMALDNAMPTSKGIAYDTATGRFRATSTGRELRPGELAGRSATAWMGSGLARTAVGGRRTIARGAVFRALLREARSGVQGQDGRRDGLLARIVGQSARLSSPDPAERIFYKATGSPVATYDSSAYEPAGTADTEAVQRLAARLNRGVAREHHVVLDAVTPRARGNGARARELAAVSTVARRIFGHRVVFVRFQGPPLFNGVASDTEPNVVFLHADSQQPLMAVLGHELLHRMRMETPNLYRDLQARLDRMMTGQSAYFDKLKAAYEHHGRTPPKEWMEELHADVVGDFFMDHRFWEEMAAEQPGLFKRVAAAILRFLDDVVNQLSDFRPFGTDKFVQDIAAARAAVAGAMRQFGGAQVGAMTNQSDGISLSVADRQAVTDTPAFRKWFGASVVTKDGKAGGEPLVVYHGSPASEPITEFKAADGGIYFTSRRDMADGYTSRRGIWLSAKTGLVTDAYVSMQNPMVIDALGRRNDNIPVPWQDWKPKVFGVLPPGAVSVRAAAERAKANGHDGLIVRNVVDTVTTTGTTKADVFVAFRPEQIKSALGNSGAFSPDTPDIRFSIADAARPAGSRVTAQDLIDSRGGIFDFNRLGATKQDRIRTVIDGSRPFWLGTLTRDQIADVYGKEIPPVKDYDTLTRSMENERSKMAGDADTLYTEWSKIDQPTNDRLARIMLDATVHQVHPDGPFTPTGENDAERQSVHSAISEQYRQLPPEAKAMYRKVKDFHIDTLTKLRDALMARIERQVEGGNAKAAALTNIRLMFDKYLTGGPYFPLSRFGDFLVVAQREDGERVVASYETAGEQQAAARKLESDGFTVKLKTAKTYSREQDGAAGKFIGDVLTAVADLDMDDASLGGRVADLKGKLLDDINQMFIKALPDLSYRRHFIHRKGTPGFSSDVMRGFASSAFHAASHIARLNHGDKMTFALQDAYAAIESAPEGDFNLHSQVLNELTRRHDAALNPNTHPIASMLNQVGFVMYLGLSPAAGIVNMLQTVMVTMPHLGARYGFPKANASLAAAYKDILAAPMNAKNGWNAAQSTKLTAAERAMMTELQDEGVIDLTQAHDLASATGLDTGNVARSKAAFAMSRAMKIVGWTFHIPEVMNRQVTALSAYRLEMAKSGNVDTAKEAAREAIKRTHFDYSSSNRARFMTGNVARVITQFKQYSQNMTYLLGRAAHQALKGESPEVRAIARKQLVATLGVTFGMAGALGLPGLGGAMGLIGLMVSAMDDDDKPWNWEVEFRNLLADTVGREAGEVIAHGIPRALMPWDISSRVSLGDLWWRSNDREGQTAREAIASDMQNILGPTWGTLLGFYTAADHMARGNWSKAVESIVPKFLRDPLKAIREGQEGITNYNGEPLLDVGAAEVVGRALGFAPARASEMFEARNAVKNAETVLNEKRQRLLSQIVKARMDGDTEAVAELRQDILEFNRRNPAFRITLDSIIKSARAKQRAMAETEGGIRVPRGKDALRDIGRFAEAG